MRSDYPDHVPLLCPRAAEKAGRECIDRVIEDSCLLFSGICDLAFVVMERKAPYK
jgi:hypothetical protein